MVITFIFFPQGQHLIFVCTTNFTVFAFFNFFLLFFTYFLLFLSTYRLLKFFHISTKNVLAKPTVRDDCMWMKLMVCKVHILLKLAVHFLNKKPYWRKKNIRHKSWWVYLQQNTQPFQKLHKLNFNLPLLFLRRNTQIFVYIFWKKISSRIFFSSIILSCRNFLSNLSKELKNCCALSNRKFSLIYLIFKMSSKIFKLDGNPQANLLEMGHSSISKPVTGIVQIKLQ